MKHATAESFLSHVALRNPGQPEFLQAVSVHNNLLYRKIFITAALTFFCLGYLDGLGIGTVLAAFTMGKVVGIIGTYTDKFFYFETYKTL